MSTVKRDVSPESAQLILAAQNDLNQVTATVNAVCAGVLSSLGLRGRITAVDQGVPGKRKPTITVELAPPAEPEARKSRKSPKEAE